MSGVLSSFLFGNIDEDGRLESNYLDDVRTYLNTEDKI